MSSLTTARVETTEIVLSCALLFGEEFGEQCSLEMGKNEEQPRTRRETLCETVWSIEIQSQKP